LSIAARPCTPRAYLARADDQQIVDCHLIQRDHAHHRPDAAAGEPWGMLEQGSQIMRRAA
jgi:hypothetical protein